MNCGWHDLGRDGHIGGFVLAFCNGNRANVFDPTQIGIANRERDLGLVSQDADQGICAGRRNLSGQEDTQGQ